MPKPSKVPLRVATPTPSVEPAPTPPPKPTRRTFTAAEKLRRRVAAIELQPAFVDGTIARWEKATGKKAVLEATGQSYAEVRDARAEVSA